MAEFPNGFCISVLTDKLLRLAVSSGHSTTDFLTVNAADFRETVKTYLAVEDKPHQSQSHVTGLQHSTVIFYLPEYAKREMQSNHCDCGRNSCVKLVNIDAGSVVADLYRCQLCYLSDLISISTLMLGAISTQCANNLWKQCGLSVETVEKTVPNLDGGSGFPHDPHFSGASSIAFTQPQTSVNTAQSELFPSFPKRLLRLLYTYITKSLFRNRRSRSAKGRT